MVATVGIVGFQSSFMRTRAKEDEATAADNAANLTG